MRHVKKKKEQGTLERPYTPKLLKEKETKVVSNKETGPRKPFLESSLSLSLDMQTVFLFSIVHTVSYYKSNSKCPSRLFFFPRS